jgi:hypothetical protein
MRRKVRKKTGKPCTCFLAVRDDTLHAVENHPDFWTATAPCDKQTGFLTETSPHASRLFHASPSPAPFFFYDNSDPPVDPDDESDDAWYCCACRAKTHESEIAAKAAKVPSPFDKVLAWVLSSNPKVREMPVPL